jgi:hypothetical protein
MSPQSVNVLGISSWDGEFVGSCACCDADFVIAHGLSASKCHLLGGGMDGINAILDHVDVSIFEPISISELKFAGIAERQSFAEQSPVIWEKLFV